MSNLDEIKKQIKAVQFEIDDLTERMSKLYDGSDEYALLREERLPLYDELTSLTSKKVNIELR